MKTIRLELARNTDNPDGNPSDAYDLHAALGPDGSVDVGETDAQLMTFVRYLPGEPLAHGQMIRTDSGDWAFSYEAGDGDDELVVGFEHHDLSVGNYLTVVQRGREEHVYRVASVEERLV